MNKFISGFVIASTVYAVACGGSAPANNSSKANNSSNTNVANVGSGPVNVDPANMPAGISVEPVKPSADTTPGIPAANTAVPKSNANSRNPESCGVKERYQAGRNANSRDPECRGTEKGDERKIARKRPAAASAR
ncbi:MAG: hypothetical protein IPP63_02460 [Chloracidobacterium sp.]|nr:hypothetical protein [Chloracidobacterium sp.]